MSMHVTTSPTTHTTPEGLRAQFHSEGYTRGVPPTLGRATLAIDLRVYCRQRCGLCRRRLRVACYSNGKQHRLLCSCKHGCKFAVEG